MKLAPEIGSFWQHQNGCKYEVIEIANEKSTRQAKYRNIVNTSTWSRPL